MSRPRRDAQEIVLPISDAEALAGLVEELEAIRGEALPDPVTPSTARALLRTLLTEHRALAVRNAELLALTKAQARHIAQS